MSAEFGPEGSEIVSADVREWRRANYSANKLWQSHGQLKVVTETIDEMMDGAAVGMSYDRDEEVEERRMGRIFVDSAETGQTFTGLSITHSAKRLPGVLREQYHISLHYYDKNYMYGNAYELRKYAGGIAGMIVQQSVEGVAEALSHDDPDRVSNVRWRDGTEYDASQLLDEVLRLYCLQLVEQSRV